MLSFFTFLMILGVGYGFLTEGLFTACTMLVNVMVAGLVAFNFYEPLAEVLEGTFAGTFALGFEDAFSMVFLFWVTLGLLRLVVNQLNPKAVEFPPAAQRIGGAAFGVITGYLLSGFFICMMQTLPWQEGFLGFDPVLDRDQPMRRYFPPDRVWLAMMHRAGSYGFSSGSERTFDNDGNFELRYARHRRYTDRREPIPYGGEFDPGMAAPPASSPEPK